MFSDPNEFKAYEPEFVEPVHMDLKRQAGEQEMLAAGLRRMAKGNSTNLPLFEKYQFFTPGRSSGCGGFSGVSNKGHRNLFGSYCSDRHAFHSRCWSQGSR